MFTPLLLLAALLFFGVMVAGIKIARRHARGALIGIAALLPALLLSVEQFVRLGWSYDLVAAMPVRIYYAEAPILPAYAIVLLVLGAATVICLALVLALATAVWLDGSARRKFLVFACLPTLALYAHQHYLIVEQEQREAAKGYRRAQQSNVRQPNACRGESPAEPRMGWTAIRASQTGPTRGGMLYERP